MYIRYIVGAVLGAAAGAVYYYLISCKTGACPLTATVYRSMAYGAVMGLFAAGAVTS